MAGKPSINDLPNEILLHILSYIGPEDVYYSVAKVCHKWNGLATDVVLWKKLSYVCNSSSDIDRICEILTVAPALPSIVICNRMDATYILEFLFRIRGDLRKLFLGYSCVGANGADLLSNIRALYPDLECLSLERCFPNFSTGYHHILHLKKLSELYLSYRQGLSGDMVRSIADSCQRLKKLSLFGVRLNDDDVIHVIKRLGKQLTTLVLYGEFLTDVAYLYLSNCARLKELKLFCCENMTARGLLEGIGSLHELTSLRLSMCYGLTARAMSTFLHRPSMTSIVSLDLSFTNLDDEGLRGIAERCKHLKELSVSDYSVTDAGISMVISRCSQLCELNLTHLKNITGEGWLALMPSHLPRLRKLLLDVCGNVCEQYVQELVAAVPELEVTRNVLEGLSAENWIRTLLK